MAGHHRISWQHLMFIHEINLDFELRAKYPLSISIVWAFWMEIKRLKSFFEFATQHRHHVHWYIRYWYRWLFSNTNVDSTKDGVLPYSSGMRILRDFWQLHSQTLFNEHNIWCEKTQISRKPQQHFQSFSYFFLYVKPDIPPKWMIKCVQNVRPPNIEIHR